MKPHKLISTKMKPHKYKYPLLYAKKKYREKKKNYASSPHLTCITALYCGSLLITA